MSKPSKKKILESIKGSGGIISTIAKRLNVTWHTAKNYCNAHEETKIALEAEKEAILDMAEGALFSKVKEKELDAVKWLLARKGKERGYSERKEITGADGKEFKADVTLKIIEPDGFNEDKD